jgi:hypothetical protein
MTRAAHVSNHLPSSHDRVRKVARRQCSTCSTQLFIKHQQSAMIVSTVSFTLRTQRHMTRAHDPSWTNERTGTGPIFQTCMQSSLGVWEPRHSYNIS